MNFRKDPLFVSLIIVLCCLILTGGYYYGHHQLSLWINGEPGTHNILTGKVDATPSENTTVSMSGIPADTAQYLDASNNTNEKTGPKNNVTTANAPSSNASLAGPVNKDENIISFVPRTDTPDFGKSIKALTQPDDNKDEDADEKATIVPVSDNPNVVCQLKTGHSQKLLVYPSQSAWHSIYLIAPISDKKMLARKNFIQPEFEGVSYPTYKAAKLSYKGKKYDVVQITYQTTAVDIKHQYSILLQANPGFVIFGEQKNSDMYVFENGRVSKFTPTSDNFNLTDN